MSQNSMFDPESSYVNLSIRETQLTDTEALFPIFNDEETVKYTNFKVYDTKEKFHEFMHGFINLNQGEPLQMGPFCILCNHLPIGLCGMQQQDLKDGSTELWYILLPQYWGKGLTKKAVELLMLKALENQELKIINATAVTKNTASWKILESFGFHRTEERKRGFQKESLIADLYSYVLKTKTSK